MAAIFSDIVGHFPCSGKYVPSAFIGLALTAPEFF